MLNRAILAALALVCALSLPVQAKTNEAREGLRQSERVSAHKIDLPGTKWVAPGKPRASSKLLAIAARDLGRNPSGWSRLWCARQMNLWLAKAGIKGSGSNYAKSLLKIGRRVSLAQAGPGDIVVTGRKGGGHVLILEGKHGKYVSGISGNSGGRGPGRRVVARGKYPVSKILGIVRVS